MECPACWTNKLLQIERNSRRLNRASWKNMLRSFSQLTIRKAEEEEKKTLPRLPLFGAVQVAFIHHAINSKDWITAEWHVEWKKSLCYVHRHHTGINIINVHFTIISVCMKNPLLYATIYGEDTLWSQSGCELYSLADSHLSSMMPFECPSWYLGMIINNHSVSWGATQVGVWQVPPMSN